MSATVLALKKTNKNTQEVQMNAILVFNMDHTKQCAHFHQILPLTKRRTDKQI